MAVKEAKSSKKERSKLKKRKLLDEENSLESPSSVASEICSGGEPDLKKMTNDKKKKKKKKKKDKTHIESTRDTSNASEPHQSENLGTNDNSAGHEYADIGTNSRTHGSKKAGKNKKKDRSLSKKASCLVEKKCEAVSDEVYHISSGDEDCTKGMKKWIMEYHQSRPGLEILQQKIDEFITAHDAQEEQARNEREAQAAEGGWTVVVHHKGRKKTTDSESGITVGSVAQAVVLDQMSKKKSKEVGTDFYRFQKREAQRNEIMTLQSKFEQDKKRIQQLRAARKFRPY